ncbi:MAG: efflux transporter periplasmic adaptor subunit [Gammaproteobacteria bacterium]|nr:efflux transporter periplasmic adaptor subunit [Gammaproteobacteria bacterium]|tara:strand:+ start:233 stop:1366 length:1134 start_codon:yes stop_codon:yes gene_type:complete
MNNAVSTALAAIAVTALLWPAPAAAAAPGRGPTGVIVERVGLQRIADSLEALGTLRANETVDITANVSDTISRVNFEDGQAVEAGDVLVELTDREESALLAEAESLAEEAQRQYERIERLVAQGNASESLLDERRREWRTADARLDAVRSRLADRLITAPFSGHVGLRMVSPGALVSPGDVITTLVDDSRMKLDFTIPALYLNTVSRGTVIEAATPVFPNRSFAGEVASVDSTIDPVTRSITVRAIIPNDRRDLVPGMLMTLNLLRNERDAIVISEEAVIPRGASTFVLVVDTSTEPYTAQERQVDLGTRLPGQVEVVSGLEIGETVISHGTLKVRPGAPVRIHAVDDGTRPIAELIKPDPDAVPAQAARASTAGDA